MIAAAALALLVATVPGAAAADADFVEYLHDTFGDDAEISAGPYCLLTADLRADCQAEVDGESHHAIGEVSDDGYIFKDAEEIVIEVAAEKAFVEWMTETYELTLLEGELGPSCFVIGSPPSDSPIVEIGCSGFHDGRRIDADAELDTESDEYTWTSDFVDLTGLDTPITDAVQFCVADDGEDSVWPDDFVVSDEGHSVVTDLGSGDVDPTFCLLGALGLPEWVHHQIELSDFEADLSWTTVSVGDFTITWLGDNVIVYDRDAGGGS